MQGGKYLARREEYEQRERERWQDEPRPEPVLVVERRYEVKVWRFKGYSVPVFPIEIRVRR